METVTPDIRLFFVIRQYTLPIELSEKSKSPAEVRLE